MRIKKSSILFIILIVFISFMLSILYELALSKVYDSRKQGRALSEIKRLNELKLSMIDEKQTIRYLIYTHSDTILRNEMTGAYMEKNLAENYTIEDVDELRRLRNVEYLYEDEFKTKCYALKGDYIIVKTLYYDELVLKAYRLYDPTIEEDTRFWYNGEILTSEKSLHTYDALTGDGISTEKALVKALIEEEIRDKH